LTIAFTIIGAAAAGVAAALIGAIKGGRLLEDWMTARARAESLRMKYFDMVSRDRLLPEPLLQLEYFRRYQLEVQCAYFKTQAAAHRRSANKALWTTAGAMAIASIAMVLAGSLSTLNVMWTSLAAVGLVSQAFSAFVENREATAQSRRNAERFTRTRQTLEDLSGRLDEVRAATIDGHPEVMQEFIGAVQEQISLEHRQWLDDSKSKGEAIGRLEELLQDYEKQRKPVAAAATPPSAPAPVGATKP
jgi:hypothetical protein